MSSPLVTVIIPTYNRAGLLPEAIESVLNQECDDFELLIIDDGSKDDTRQVVAGIVDPRIRYVYQANQGISMAMNAGLSRARGKYIARLDSDDLWLPCMLHDLVDVLESKPGYGLAYARTQTMDATGKLLDEFRGIPLWYPGDAFASMLYGDVTCNTSIVVRRECINTAGVYDPSLKVHEDWDMWVRVARVCPFFFLDKVVARYRYHSQNITGKNSGKYIKNIDERIRVLEKAFADENLPASALEVKPLAFANAYIWMGVDWWERRFYRAALNRFWKAWQVRRYSIVALFEIGWGVIARAWLWKTAWGQKFVLKIRHRKSVKIP